MCAYINIYHIALKNCAGMFCTINPSKAFNCMLASFICCKSIDFWVTYSVLSYPKEKFIAIMSVDLNSHMQSPGPPPPSPTLDMWHNININLPTAKWNDLLHLIIFSQQYVNSMAELWTLCYWMAVCLFWSHAVPSQRTIHHGVVTFCR